MQFIGQNCYLFPIFGTFKGYHFYDRKNFFTDSKIWRPNAETLRYNGTFYFHWVNGVAVSPRNDNMIALITKKSEKDDGKYSIQTYNFKTDK